MKRISTDYTFSIKAAPYIFWGFLGVFFWLLLVNGAYQQAPIFLVIVAVMAVIGYFQTKTLRRNLVDEVYDCGDSLLLRKGGEEDTVLLSNIANVNFSTRPSRITLTLSAPGKFGSEVAFVPPPQIYFGAVPQNKIADDLIARTLKARTASAF